MSEESRHDLSEAAWALLEPQLPDRTPRRGGRWVDHRKIVDGIRWRTRTGAPWRDVPACYGHWRTVYGRHRRWCADGTWANILDAIRVEADLDPSALDDDGAWNVSVDSTVTRASADAAGARHAPPVDVSTELLSDLAAAVPAGASTARREAARARSTQAGSSGSPPPPATADAGDASPAARTENPDADGVDAGHGDAGEGGAGGQRPADRAAG